MFFLPNGQVCAAFVQLIEIHPSFLEVGIFCCYILVYMCLVFFCQFTDVIFTISQPHLKNIIEYMLQVNKDTDDEVALEACEFW